MSESVKQSVPKFTSFRAKPPSKADAASETEEIPWRRDIKSYSERRHEGRHRHDQRHEEGSHKGDKDHGQRRKRDERDTTKDGHGLATASSKEIVREPALRGLEQGDVFKVDRVGDPQNLQYGKLHRYSIPNYRRGGHGFVIGLDRQARIERTNDEQIVIATHQPTSRDRPNYASSRWENSRMLRLIQRESGENFDPDRDFIPTGGARKRRKLNVSTDEAALGMPDYRTLEEDTRDPDEPEDADLEYPSDSSTERNNVEDDQHVKEENARLVRLTVAEPTNAQAWLDLIDHQESMHLLGRSGLSDLLTAADKRVLADVRSAMYEEAIKAVRSGDVQIDLILRHIDEVADYWERKRLAKYWQEVVEQYTSSAKLWTRYLDFLQTSVTQFRFEVCKASYLKCLSVLRTAITKESNGSAASEYLQSLLVHVFTRFTFMIREAGYSELAVALWQGALEFNILSPERLKHSRETERLLAFEEFWESEVLRIGEDGAQGWRNYNDESVPPDPDTTTVNPDVRGDPYRRLTEAERLGTMLMKYPGRTADDLGAEDPYHVIMFSDIKETLCMFPADFSASRLIQGYLCFVRLPQLVDSDEKLSNTLSQDPFLQYQPLSSGTYDLERMKTTCYVQTINNLFSCAFPGKMIQQDSAWVQRTLALLVRASPEDDRLAEYYLALVVYLQSVEWTQSSVAKIVKAVLKAHPTSLRLYNVYGIIEARIGKQTFHNVFATALSMGRSLPSEVQHESMLLWLTWAHETMRNGDTHLTRQILHSIGRANIDFGVISASVPNSESMLRSSKTIAETRDLAMSMGRFHHAVIAAECLAILYYFQHEDGTDLDAAMKVYQEADSKFQDRQLAQSAPLERLHQARADLFTYHMAHVRSYKPAVIRAALQESIERFPNNTMLLCAFAVGETRFRIEDRVRAAADKVLAGIGTGSQETFITHLFTITTEIRRMNSQAGTEHAVRAAFDRAVQSKSGRHCPALWTLYLQFELGVRGTERTSKKVKDVFFKGISRLPWCKKFMMEAFSDELRMYMTQVEQRRVYNVMEEKELRLFGDLNQLPL